MDAPVEVHRSAVRFLILDDEQRLLLLHYLTPDTGEDFWCTPGGALDAGESELEAARRELWDEVGVDGVGDLGTPVWQRTHRFRIGDGRLFVQEERFYALRRRNFAPVSRGLGEFEAQAIAGHRWWTLQQLRSTEESLSPENLADLVARVQRASAC